MTIKDFYVGDVADLESAYQRLLDSVEEISMDQKVELFLGAAIDVVAEVKRLGHESVEKFQEWSNLKVDGVAGPITTNAIAGRFCGMPDFNRTEAEAATVPQSCMDLDFAYDFTGANGQSGMSGVSNADIEEAVRLASVHISAISGLNIKPGGTLQTADIYADLEALRGGTLAYSFLWPDNRCGHRIRQAYDNSNRQWHVDMLAKVIVHEWGHAVGFEHSNDPRDIMYPSIDPSKRLNDYPGPNDRQRFIDAFGPNVNPDPPPVDPGDDRSNELADRIIKACQDHKAAAGGSSSSGGGWF